MEYLKKIQWTSTSALIVYWVTLTLAVMAPYVFLGRLIAPGADAIAQFYPAMYWFSETVRAGDSILWDQAIFSGFPAYLSQISGYLEPLNLLLFSTIPSFLLAYHIRLVIDYVLVMLFSYLAARLWNISKLAAFFIGPAFILSFHWWYLSTTVVANSLFVLPFIFWVYLSALQASTFWRKVLWGILGGIGIGWAFLGGYAQFNVYTLFFIGLFAVYDFLFLTATHLKTVREALIRSLILGLFAGVGFGIGSPVILAATDYIPFTVRSGGVEYSLTQLKTLTPTELVYFLFPDYLRLPFLMGGKKTIFIGIFSLMCALVAMLHLKRNRLIPIFTGLFAFAFVLALPGSPVYYALHKLPVFELFRFPHRWMYLGVWFMCLLGALGFDMLRDGITTTRTKVIGISFSIFAGLLTLFVVACTFAGAWFWTPVKILAFILFQQFAYSPDTFSKGLDHYHGALERGIDAWRTLASLENAYFSIPLLLFIAACTVYMSRVYGLISVRSFERAAAVVLIATFVGLFAVRWQDSLPGDTLWSHKASAGELIPRADLEMYRVFPFHNSYSYRPRETSLIWSREDTLAGVELQHAVAAPNDHRYAGFLLVEGYDPFIARDLQKVFAVLASNFSSEDLVKGISLEDRQKQFLQHLDLVGMMSGKYIISGFVLQHKDLRLIGSPRASRYDVPYYVYEYKRATSRVRLATTTLALPHSTVMELVDGGRSFTDAVYLDCNGCASIGSPQSTVRVEDVQNGYFEIMVDAKKDEWLIVSEQFLPGWHVTIDGAPAEITRANGMYMAIRVEQGVHRIKLQYEGMRGEARWLRYLGLFPHELIEKR